MPLRAQTHDQDAPVAIVLLLIMFMLCAAIALVKWSLELMKAQHRAVLPTYATQDGLESINIRIQFTPVHQSTVRHRAVSSLDLGPSSATIAVTNAGASRCMKKD